MTRLASFQPLPWVDVVPLEAFFAVACKRCGATDTLYFAGAKRDPTLLAHVHDSHRLCKEAQCPAPTK